MPLSFSRSSMRVLPAKRPWALHDVVSSRAIEAREIASHADGELMQRAGRSIARLARALYPHARSAWIAAGPGGNGGDGLHAAAELRQLGLQVQVLLCADFDRLAADAKRGLRRAIDAGAVISADGISGDSDLSIDALLGLGGSRAPEGRIAAAINVLHTRRQPCLAVDLPSGLCANTGRLLGETAVRATHTLALLTLKPGLFTGQGRDHAGDIWLDDLLAGARPEDPAVARLGSVADWLAVDQPRLHAQHKGSFGDVVVVGGAPGMSGAARLAAHAVLAAGAGRTIVSLLDPQAPHVDVTRPEWLWQTAAWLPGQADLEQCTVVAGCGGGHAIQEALPALISRAARLVLDADALNAIARDPALDQLLQARGRRGAPAVLTPHPLEAARLLGSSTAEVQSHRLQAAQALADRWKLTVVLKGSGTITASPSTTPCINSSGNAALAAGGTGDVLAGWMAGLWAAQGEAGADQGSAHRCACAAVWLHGAAADFAPEQAGRARELVEAMHTLRAAGLGT